MVETHPGTNLNPDQDNTMDGELSYTFPSFISLPQPITFTVTHHTSGRPSLLEGAQWSRYHQIHRDGQIDNTADPDLRFLRLEGTQEERVQVTKSNIPLLPLLTFSTGDKSRFFVRNGPC